MGKYYATCLLLLMTASYTYTKQKCRLFNATGQTIYTYSEGLGKYTPIQSGASEITHPTHIYRFKASSSNIGRTLKIGTSESPDRTLNQFIPVKEINGDIAIIYQQDPTAPSGLKQTIMSEEKFREIEDILRKGIPAPAQEEIKVAAAGAPSGSAFLKG